MANAYERYDISDESWVKIELLLPDARGLGAVTLATIGNLSMRYFGFCKWGHLGEIYRQAMAIGKISTDVFVAGATRAFGRTF